MYKHYNWQNTTVKHILDNPQYTGCTVNGRSSIVSYKVHKKIEYDESERQIIPNTQEAIIDEETFNTVHEMRASRRRNTATGRTSLFSNLVFCGDCGSKMYFCAAKSINENQEFWLIIISGVSNIDVRCPSACYSYRGRVGRMEKGLRRRPFFTLPSHPVQPACFLYYVSVIYLFSCTLWGAPAFY